MRSLNAQDWSEQCSRAVCTNIVVMEMHSERRGAKRLALAGHANYAGQRASCEVRGEVACSLPYLFR